MKPIGIRKVINEQGVEGACVYLAEALDAVIAEREAAKAKAKAAAAVAPKEGE